MKLIGKYPVFSILLIGLIVRLILYFISKKYGYTSFFLFDSYRYLNLGTNLFEEGWYTDKMNEPIFESIYLTPLAPLIFYFLRSLGGLDAIIIFQIICQLITCYFLIKTAKIFFPHLKKFAVFFCGFLFAFDIPTIVLGNVIMTETIFTLLFFLFTYYFIQFLLSDSSKKILLSSLFLGLAALTRPIVIYLPFLILIILFIRFYKLKKFEFKNLLYFLFPFYLFTGTWTYINYQKHNHFFYSMVGEFNLMYFQASTIHAEINTISLEEARIKLYKEIENSFSESEYENLDQYIYFKRGGEIARQIILENPFTLLKNATKAHINLFFRPVRDYLKITLGSAELFYTRSKNHSAFIYFTDYWQIFINISLFLLLLPGIIYIYLINPQIAFFMICIFGYFMLVCSGPEIDGRFRVPLVPVILINACAGVVFIIDKIKARRFSASTNNSTFVP